MEWYHIAMIVIFTVKVCANILVDDDRIPDVIMPHGARIIFSIVWVYIMYIILDHGGFWN